MGYITHIATSRFYARKGGAPKFWTKLEGGAIGFWTTVEGGGRRILYEKFSTFAHPPPRLNNERSLSNQCPCRSSLYPLSNHGALPVPSY